MIGERMPTPSSHTIKKRMEEAQRERQQHLLTQNIRRKIGYIFIHIEVRERVTFTHLRVVVRMVMRSEECLSGIYYLYSFFLKHRCL